MILGSSKFHCRVIRWPAACCLLHFVLVLCVLFAPTFAQRPRPKVIPAHNQQYAGRLLLLPRDGRPASWKLPRMIARIADYEIVYPPREMLGDATTGPDVARIIGWAKKQELRQFKGVIVSLEAMATATGETNAKEQLEFIRYLRQQAPNLLIYGFATRTSEAINQSGFDDLLIEPNTEGAAYLLVARMLHRLHQRPLKVVAITSDNPTPSLTKAITDNVAAVGGQFAKNERADVILFVHTPGTDAIKLATFTESLAKSSAAGYYVALADVSNNRDPVIAGLRERKQLGLLQFYAAARDPNEALGKVLAQCSTRLVAAKVLRPGLEVEQLRRAERAQVELLLTRYLEDWVYEGSLRTRTEQYIREQLKADPKQLGAATEKAETFVNDELRPLAEELFRTQFRHNLHSVILGNGTQADFQVELLQRLKARFPLQDTDEFELDISVHMPLLIGLTQYLRK